LYPWFHPCSPIAMAQVLPNVMDADAVKPLHEGGIPLANLDPDLDGSGNVDDWEKEVYDRIVTADTDNTGLISVRNLFDLIRAMSMEVREASKGGIPITSLNPDTDGDGKVEPWEMDVFKRIQGADADKSGSISVKELFGVIKGAAESDKQKKLFQRLFFVALAIIVLLVAAMFVVSVAAGEAIKESKVSSDSAEMLALDGSVVNTGLAEAESTIWDTALLTPYELGKINFFSFYVDLTSVASIGAWAEMTLRPVGAFKVWLSDAIFSTAEGHEVDIRGSDQTGTIRFGSGALAGSTFSIAETIPASASRKLEESKPNENDSTLRTPELTPLTTDRRDELTLPREEARLRRKLGRRGGSIQMSTRHRAMAMSSRGGRGNRCGND